MDALRPIRRLAERELLEADGTWVTVGRRKSHRFPIQLDVRFRTLGRRPESLSGTGKTINISSSGVLFTSPYEIPVGTRIEVSMRWPVELNEKCGFNLLGRGRTVRHAKGQVAVRVEEWHFRTTGEAAAGK